MQALKNTVGTPVTLACEIFQIQQDKQYMYNVTLWSIRLTIVAVETQQ